MKLLIWILQIVLVLWIVRFLWRTVSGWFAASQDSAEFRPPGSRPGDSGQPASRLAPRELVKDPQCGTYVSPDVSVHTRFRGQELHFCSRECEQRFLQSQSELSA